MEGGSVGASDGKQGEEESKMRVRVIQIERRKLMRKEKKYCMCYREDDEERKD